MEPDKFLKMVERALVKTGLPPSTFGRMAAKDPLFVFQLREGREPRAATRERVLAFMRDYGK